jgi:hypothetical protein
MMLEECGYRILRYRFDAGRYATWKREWPEVVAGWTHRAFPKLAPRLVGGSVSVLAAMDTAFDDFEKELHDELHRSSD